MSSLVKTYRRIRFGPPVIVVSGLPRSGTSMAMKMLTAAGLPAVVDDVRTADEDNPRGYFEDERVKPRAHEALERFGWMPDDGFVTHVERRIQEHRTACMAFESFDKFGKPRVCLRIHRLHARGTVDVCDGGKIKR